MKTVAIISSLLLILISSNSFAKDFSQTCKSIRLAGNFLKATCEKRNQEYTTHTEIKIDKIVNRRGELKLSQENFYENSFFKTCENVKLKVVQDCEKKMTILYADCHNGFSGSRSKHLKTSLVLDNYINNRNGHLVWD